jgi:hypothetical protein
VMSSWFCFCFLKQTTLGFTRFLDFAWLLFLLLSDCGFVVKNGSSAGKIIMEETTGNIERALLANYLPAGDWFAFRLHVSAVLPGTKEENVRRFCLQENVEKHKDFDLFRL